MDKLKKFKEYLKLYFKSLTVVWNSSKPLSFFMVIITPALAIIPALSIMITNLLLNNLMGGDINYIMILIILWGLLFILSNILLPINTMIQGYLTDKLTYKLNQSLMEKSAELQSIDYFEDSSFFDDIEIISKEANWRPVNLLVFGFSIISNYISLFAMFTLLAQFSVWIAISIVFALVPQGIIFYKIQQQAFETLVSNSSNSRRLNYYSHITLASDYIKEVRVYNLYDYFISKYQLVFKQIIDSVQKNRLKQFIFSALFLLVTAGISIASFFYVLMRVKAGEFEIGAVLVFSSSIVYAVQNVSRIVEEGSLLYDTLLYMDKYFRFMEIENKLKSGNLKFSDTFNNIEFKNISFSYPNSEKLALNNVSFTIKSGEKVALVGENGSGKSTLIKLFCRLYNLEEGQILFDGINYTEFDVDNYRKHFSVVFQDFSKYDLSLRENIAVADISEIENSEKIEKVLKDLSIEDNDLEKQLGTKFNGCDLSGGQWQRIAIARAFFGDKEILLLDEPTAAIDAKMEYKLYQDFFKLMRNKTVIFITHRLATVKHADKILLLKDGKLLDYDNHQNLLKANQYYKELYNMQADIYKD